MLFHWIRDWRRKRIRARRPSDSFRQDILDGAWQWKHVPREVQNRAVEWSQVFVLEKYWEGCDGFQVNERIKRIVGSQAALLTVAFPDWFFDPSKTILIYPNAYIAQGPMNELGNGLAIHGESIRGGQTSYRGPIILNWSDIDLASFDPNDGHHLVVHELAHQFDMINDRSADGVPPLPPGTERREWQESWRTEFESLRQCDLSLYDVLIDDYGLMSPAEFFAVSSELYFQLPHELSELHPNVYELLNRFYRTDWREWLPRWST